MGKPKRAFYPRAISSRSRAEEHTTEYKKYCDEKKSSQYFFSQGTLADPSLSVWAPGMFFPLESAVADADVFFYTAAAFADGESQTECEVHAAAVDGNPLGGVFGNQNVGADKKVDPVRADVHAYAYCAAVSALEGVASREGKPAGRRKVDRSRDAVEVFIFPQAHLVEGAEADTVLPQPVGDAGVERGA